MCAAADFRGYYCRQCHTYSRLYRKESENAFTGICPKCGRHIHLPAGNPSNQLFFSGGSSTKKINIWDSYTGGKIIGQVAKGTRAKVLETKTLNSVIWYKVRSGKITGWVSGMFIRNLHS